MSDKAYITFHYEESDGSEIKVKDALLTDAATIGELFERFLDFLVSMSFTEEQIKKILKDLADTFFVVSEDTVLRACSNDTCSKVFQVSLNNKRKIYCSTKCSQNKASKMYRERKNIN